MRGISPSLGTNLGWRPTGFTARRNAYRRRMSPVQGSPPVLSEGPEPGVLLRLVATGMPVVAAPSLGGSDMGPARRRVQYSGEARGLDEDLDQHEGGVVARGPVHGQLPATQNNPLGEPPSLVSERESLSQAIGHLRVGGDSPQPPTEVG